MIAGCCSAKVTDRHLLLNNINTHGDMLDMNEHPFKEKKKAKTRSTGFPSIYLRKKTHHRLHHCPEYLPSTATQLEFRSIAELIKKSILMPVFDGNYKRRKPNLTYGEGLSDMFEVLSSNRCQTKSEHKLIETFKEQHKGNVF
uniref:Uncharacterized protein n=1 Tax=Glossina palpalis gambiensis TaxID=67801 RepID=A0A1B0BRS7_9MUSC